jgi:CheY-like chemotaxis protein
VGDEGAEAPRGGGETVLLAEDDALVHAALAETLRDRGYRVVEAADADAALAVLDARTAVDAVLTDLAMPSSMDGLGFAAVARARRPGLPVVVTTGHLDPLHGGRRLPEGIGVVQKPHRSGAWPPRFGARSAAGPGRRPPRRRHLPRWLDRPRSVTVACDDER